MFNIIYIATPLHYSSYLKYSIKHIQPPKSSCIIQLSSKHFFKFWKMRLDLLKAALTSSTLQSTPYNAQPVIVLDAVPAASSHIAINSSVCVCLRLCVCMCVPACIPSCEHCIAHKWRLLKANPHRYASVCGLWGLGVKEVRQHATHFTLLRFMRQPLAEAHPCRSYLNCAGLKRRQLRTFNCLPLCQAVKRLASVLLPAPAPLPLLRLPLRPT